MKKLIADRNSSIAQVQQVTPRRRIVAVDDDRWRGEYFMTLIRRDGETSTAVQLRALEGATDQSLRDLTGYASTYTGVLLNNCYCV